MKQWMLLTAAVSLLPIISYADTPPAAPAPAPATPPPPPSPWVIDAAVGYIRTTGNTDSDSLSVKGNADWKSGPWENQTHILGSYASSLGETTTESYSFNDKLNRDLDPLEYVFANFGYSDDRFAGVVSLFSESFGYGRHLVKTPAQTLDADIGAGLSQMRDSGNTSYDGQFIGVFNLNYLLKISSNAQYKQTLHIEAGIDNTFVNPVAELKLNVIGNVFVTVDYDWRHNTSVPAGTVHTDTIASLSFGYTFGKKP